MKFKIICDIMVNLVGSVRPAIYLAIGLAARGHEVSMVSPIMSSAVERKLQMSGIQPLSLHAKHITNDSNLSLLWFETWAQEAFLRLNQKRIGEKESVVNFSQTISAPSTAWYLQGPPSVALKDMEKELSTDLRIAYKILRPFINYADRKLVKQMGRASVFVIANSKFCASMYSEFGVKTREVIYPPIDHRTFHPSISDPSSNYVLTYYGKETKFSVVKMISDMGVKVKAFGSKSPFIQKALVKHHNIEFFDRIATKELVDAYSNALFTLFPFTHEPFGYVPLESMACGTPVLTYNMQGPSECVLDGRTGWLADSDEQLVHKAIELWKNGYSPSMRSSCIEAASKFDKEFYIEKWSKVLKA